MKSFNRVLGVVLAVTLCAFQASAQGSVQAGIFNPVGKDSLIVKARPTFVVTNKGLTNFVVTIRWLTSYNITLEAPSSTFGVVQQNVVATNGLYSYQTFNSVPSATVTWGAGSENELFRTRIIGASPGFGTFELTDVGAANTHLYIELGAGDSTNHVSPYYVSSTAAPLPVQIASFAAIVAGASEADIRWSTVSEMNNYGFEVQKSSDRATGFQSISGSFTAGNGTTNERHDYAYADKGYAAGATYYRLKQIDKDATVHYTESIQPSGLNGVTEKKPLPTEYALSQNYPNPFNPSTVIEFALPRDTQVKLEVFNVIGQKVMTLVDEVRPAGYHAVRLDGKDLASGMYLYRLNTGNQTFMRKLLLLK